LLRSTQNDKLYPVRLFKHPLSPSPVNDLENALGQYILYRDTLARLEPERILYLAIRQEVYQDFFKEEIAQMVVENNHLKLIVFDVEKIEVVQWIN
jgi:hypothetical protein